MSEQVELEGVVVQMTDDAILWDFEGVECWIPRSQTDFGGAEEPKLKRNYKYKLWVPAWLAENEGLDT